jgi:hypothetical protein
MSRALVMLAQRGVNAEAAARESLSAIYDPLRAIFEKDALAEVPIF